MMIRSMLMTEQLTATSKDCAASFAPSMRLLTPSKRFMVSDTGIKRHDAAAPA